MCPPNTGDKLRGARALSSVDDDDATAAPADYHASLRLLPRLVSFIALFDGWRILARPSAALLEQRIRVMERRQAEQKLNGREQAQDGCKEDALLQRERHTGAVAPPSTPPSNRKPH